MERSEVIKRGLSLVLHGGQIRPIKGFSSKVLLGNEVP